MMRVLKSFRSALPLDALRQRRPDVLLTAGAIPPVPTRGQDLSQQTGARVTPCGNPDCACNRDGPVVPVSTEKSGGTRSGGEARRPSRTP